MGYIFDASEPAKQNRDILTDIQAHSNSLNELVAWLKQYAGQYVIIFNTQEQSIIIQDARSLREVYYCTKPNLVLCGSQPNLIARYGTPTLAVNDDPVAVRFYRSEMRNSHWVGDETAYKGINHLLPSHYLDLNTVQVHRYWPNRKLQPLSFEDAVGLVGRFLQGMLQAAATRYPLMMAVTAGIDSRTLLSASKPLHKHIYYFVNKERDLTDQSPDISIPSAIFSGLNSPFHVHQVPRDVDKDFKQIFLENAFLASERILPTVYNVYHKHHSHRLNILGLGEVGRSRYGQEPRNLTGYYLAHALGYPSSVYAVRQCEKWLADVSPASREHGFNIMNLLYLEQRAGTGARWGTPSRT